LDPLIATLMLNDELDVIYEAPSLDKLDDTLRVAAG
jgi:hypothetical protein